MADFFAFAQSGDDCLGESICPVNSLACWAQGQCLRTANNTITFGSDMYNKLEPHLKGQVISGFLWDMRKGSEIPAEAVDAMVYRSIDFFVSNSGIRDLILGLMLADKEKFDGQYSCKVINYANARGFGSLTSDIDCNDSNQWTNLIGVKVPGSGDNSSRTSQKKKESHSSCGTISSPDETQPFFVVFLLLFGPVLLVLFSALFRKNNKSV
jgi:hypothetical protein